MQRIFKRLEPACASNRSLSINPHAVCAKEGWAGGSPSPAVCAVLLMLVATVLAGCASSKPARFYILHTPGDLVSDRTESGDLSAQTVAVGPVIVPKHLQRSVILTQSSESELAYSEFQRWAGPLENNIQQVVSENLSILLGTERVT